MEFQLKKAQTHAVSGRQGRLGHLSAILDEAMGGDQASTGQSGLLDEAKDRPDDNGPMKDYDWKAVAKAMGGKLLKAPGQKQPAVIWVKNDRYEFHDNGGEINIARTMTVGESVPFWSDFHPGGVVGPLTLAYRLGAEISGKPIDYRKNLDEAATSGEGTGRP